MYSCKYPDSKFCKSALGCDACMIPHDENKYNSLDEPAFPEQVASMKAESGELCIHEIFGGFSKRQHLAIDLQVPLSGAGQIDRMINKKRREEISMRVLQAIVSKNPCLSGRKSCLEDHMRAMVIGAISIADIMIEELDKNSEQA